MDRVVQLKEKKVVFPKAGAGREMRSLDRPGAQGFPCCYKRRIPGLSEGLPGVPRTLTRGWKIHKSVT